MTPLGGVTRKKIPSADFNRRPVHLVKRLKMGSGCPITPPTGMADFPWVPSGTTWFGHDLNYKGAELK
jgi:hypothetical protein